MMVRAMVITKFAKSFYGVILISIVILSMWYNLDLNHDRAIVTVHKGTYFRTLAISNKSNSTFRHILVNKTTKPLNKLKTILVWTLPTRDPIKYLGRAQSTFRYKNCTVQNCFVSSDRLLFKDEADFDVIVFHAPDLSDSDLPKSRSPHQKYIFASMESAYYYPNCHEFYNNFFNWTWTYKLNSDNYYGYIIVRNKKGEIIGPRQEMHWEKLESMDPINDTIKEKLSTKTTAAAWFVSNCRSKNHRDVVAKDLQTELEKFGLTLHIYGQCGTKQCPRNITNECLRKLETDYYFYLSFENSFSEDYVTEKLLRPLQNYAVPIVYGGANYTRFMPDGIYLDARKLSSKELALQMAEIIKDKEKYYSFFKWHNHYTYQSLPASPETNSYCNLCALINNEELFTKTSIYENFTRWWAPELCKL